MVDTKQFQGDRTPEIPASPDRPVASPDREGFSREVSKPAEEERTPPSLTRTTAPQPSVPQPVFTPKSQMRREIESVLEEDLDFLYTSLSPKQRQQFRIEGERTAAKIEIALRRAVVKLIEIITLVRKWLKLLPGVDRFFIEQEAKIKAERVLLIKESTED